MILLLISACLLLSAEQLEDRLDSLDGGGPGRRDSAEPTDGGDTGVTGDTDTGDPKDTGETGHTGEPACEYQGTAGVGVATVEQLESAANAGGVVCLSPGRYEVNLELAKDTVLLGEGDVVLDGTGRGGVLRSTGTKLVIEGLTIENGSAASGAGLWLSGCNVALSNVVIRSNTCSAEYCEGVGIRAELSDVGATAVRVLESYGAPTSSGLTAGIGVHLVDVRLAVAGLEIDASQADASGLVLGVGAYLLGGTVNGTDLTVTDSRCETDSNENCRGTGMYANGVEFTAARVLVAGNRGPTVGTGVGGGMFLESSTGEFQNLIVLGNASGFGGGGGGIYLFGGDLSIINADLVGNEADTKMGSGGGLVVDGGAQLSLANASVAYNTAAAAVGISEFSGEIDGQYCNLFKDEWVPGVSSEDFAITSINPGYLDTSAISPSDWDLHLGGDSGMRNTGDPAISDADGSRSDIGGFGGPEGSGW